MYFTKDFCKDTGVRDAIRIRSRGSSASGRDVACIGPRQRPALLLLDNDIRSLPNAVHVAWITQRLLVSLPLLTWEIIEACLTTH